MRILTVASEVPPVRSGVARSVGRVADGLRAAGHSVTVLSYTDARLYQRDRFRLSTLGLRLSTRVRFLRQFDVVLLHGPAPTVSGILLATWRLRRVRVPLVYTHHFTVWFDGPVLGPVSRAYERMTRWLARAASVVVTTTPSYRDLMCAPTQDCRVIPWGVDSRPDRVRHDPSGPLRVLLVGQLRGYKGHDVAIEAVRGVAGIELTIVGQGPRLAELERTVADLPNVTLRTDVDDRALASLYPAHDVILLPALNRSEAFGISLLEGMAAGCVPVASDLPGVDDVAGPTGLLFAPGDPAALRSQLLSLAADRTALAARSEQALAFAAEHPWERTVGQYLAVLADVAGS